MNRLFGMMRYNKQLLIVFIVAIFEIVFALGVLVFDIIQLLLVKNNAAKLATAFVSLNISLIVISVLTFALLFSMFLVKYFKGKRNESKKD